MLGQSLYLQTNEYCRLKIEYLRYSFDLKKGGSIRRRIELKEVSQKEDDAKRLQQIVNIH